jgi:hypothetical protein
MSMKKGLFTLMLILFLMSSIYMLFAQEKRIYNDGNIDYAPLSASFALSAEDFESTLKEIQYSLDGSAIQVYRGPINFSDEGRHVIGYRAVDLTGNISTEKIYSVVIDGTPPDGIATVEGPVYMGGDTVYITKESSIFLWAEDNLSGVESIYVKLDNGPYMAYTGPVAITEEGPHTAQTYAVDNVGNKTLEFTVEGYVDSTPPTIRITPQEAFVVVGGKNYTNKHNEFFVSAKDEISGVQQILVSFDGSDYVTYTTPFKVQVAGFHTVRSKAIDNLGNASAPLELSFYVDMVPPESKLGASVK